MLVSLFCENRSTLFDDDFYDCLPQYCPECGIPTEMSETLTGLHCSNPRCHSKVAQRLVSIANQLGIKDLGEARAEKYVRKFNITNPLMIYKYSVSKDGRIEDSTNEEISKRIEDAFQSKKKFTLAEFVKIANIPNVQMSAFEIFGSFDDLGEAYKAIESGGVEYIRDKLNIKSKGSEDISVRALKVYESLLTFKSDLFDVIDSIDIIKINTPDMTTIKAVCSTEVGDPYKTKADFYASCNNLYPNIHIEFGNSVTKKTDYLVWAGADGTPRVVTNKVKKARSYIEQGVDIKIVTAMEFLGVLQKLAGGD